MRWKGVDLIDLAPNREKWGALVRMEINLRVPQNARRSLTR